jgi:hypothetical protein
MRCIEVEKREPSGYSNQRRPERAVFIIMHNELQRYVTDAGASSVSEVSIKIHRPNQEGLRGDNRQDISC